MSVCSPLWPFYYSLRIVAFCCSLRGRYASYGFQQDFLVVCLFLIALSTSPEYPVGHECYGYKSLPILPPTFRFHSPQKYIGKTGCSATQCYLGFLFFLQVSSPSNIRRNVGNGHYISSTEWQLVRLHRQVERSL